MLVSHPPLEIIDLVVNPVDLTVTCSQHLAATSKVTTNEIATSKMACTTMDATGHVVLLID